MRSRRSSDRRHGGSEPPEFLIDRSLGRLLLPAALRQAGLIVRTLADVYGELAAQDVEDREWISLAAQNDWVVLCKDDRIRRRPAERDALIDGQVRAVCLTNANLPFAEQAACFVANRHRILQASRKPGPYRPGRARQRPGDGRQPRAPTPAPGCSSPRGQRAPQVEERQPPSQGRDPRPVREQPTAQRHRPARAQQIAQRFQVRHDRSSAPPVLPALAAWQARPRASTFGIAHGAAPGARDAGTAGARNPEGAVAFASWERDSAAGS